MNKHIFDRYAKELRTSEDIRLWTHDIFVESFTDMVGVVSETEMSKLAQNITNVVYMEVSDDQGNIPNVDVYIRKLIDTAFYIGMAVMSQDK